MLGIPKDFGIGSPMISSNHNLQRKQPTPEGLSPASFLTPILTVGIMCLVIVGVELSFRLRNPSINWPIPNYGTSRNYLNVDIMLLDQFRENGSVDCIIMGSSLAEYAVDPVRFAEAYRQETGQAIRCFNFGQPSFTAHDTVLWAAILRHRYQPRLLIWPQSARDYDLNEGAESEGTPADIPWGRYELGEWTLEGWMVRNLTSYRYFKVFQNWVLGEYPIGMTTVGDYLMDHRNDGFIVEHDVEDVSILPPPTLAENGWVSNYEFS